MSPQVDPKIVKVVIVEDHLMFREWLVKMLAREPGFAVCGEADNIQQGLNIIQRETPDIAIVDITLRGSSGLELIKDLKAHGLTVPVLVLSMHDEMLYAERVLRAGAKGYISKSEASGALTQAIRQVLSGKVYLGEKMTAFMLNKVANPGATTASSRMNSLADRELEVFQLIGRGYNSHEIAEQLHLGETTVDTYRARIKEKLQIRSVPELYTKAAQWVLENGG
jgi:DNA-binding NarL/FixJ family response regulator